MSLQPPRHLVSLVFHQSAQILLIVTSQYKISVQRTQANLVLTPVIWYTEYYEFIYRYGEVLTQLPYEIKVKMPPTDRGKRGYSNKLTASLRSN